MELYYKMEYVFKLFCYGSWNDGTCCALKTYFLVKMLSGMNWLSMAYSDLSAIAEK
jgi:hypothetical protein